MACQRQRQTDVSDGVTSVASVAPTLDFEVSVGAVTDAGPRPVNADRFYTSHSPADGSWVIAVADGVGGNPEAGDAAVAAVEGLPDRVDSLDAMRDAFVVAADRVAAMAPSREDFGTAERARLGDTVYDLTVRSGASANSLVASCPLCTLCVAAWTPSGGLLVASMGDTLAFEVRWPPSGTPWRRLIADPHRRPFVGLSSYLGAYHDGSAVSPPPGDYRYHRDYLNPYFAAVQVDLPSDPATAVAVIVASDGAWEPLQQVINAAYHAARPEARREPVELPAGWADVPVDAHEDPLPPLYHHHSGVDHSRLAHAVASVTSSAASASTIAGRVLDASRLLGLEDNATVAAAVMSPTPDPPP